MNIAVNCRLLLKNRHEGIGRFTNEILKHITTNHPEHQFIFIFDRKYSDEFIYSKNIVPVVLPPQARHPLLFIYWFDYAIPKILKQYQADVFLSTDGYLSLKTDVPQVQVIHDLAFEHFPQYVPKFASWHYKKYFPKYAEKAAEIVAVSEFTKNDIVEKYKISASKISVVYNAASEIFQPINEAEKKEIRKKYSENREYILYSGSIHPRKNVGNLLIAFDIAKPKLKNIKLLVSGSGGWMNYDVKKIYNEMQYKNDVLFVNNISDYELSKLVAASTCISYISLFEGFGLPIVEAMQCGTPVITSDTSSMPEIAGGAALLVNPFSPTSIAENIISIVNEKVLAEKLRIAGLKRAKDFSWEKSAEKLFNVIQKCVSE